MPFSSVQDWQACKHYWVTVAGIFTCYLLPFELVKPKELADITLAWGEYSCCSSSGQAKRCLQLVSLTIRTVRTTQDVKEHNNVAVRLLCFRCDLLMQL